MVLLLICISCKYITVKWASVYPSTVLIGFVIHQPYKSFLLSPLCVTLLFCNSLYESKAVLTHCENV